MCFALAKGRCTATEKAMRSPSGDQSGEKTAPMPSRGKRVWTERLETSATAIWSSPSAYVVKANRRFQNPAPRGWFRKARPRAALRTGRT